MFPAEKSVPCASNCRHGSNSFGLPPPAPPPSIRFRSLFQCDCNFPVFHAIYLVSVVLVCGEVLPQHLGVFATFIRCDVCSRSSVRRKVHQKDSVDLLVRFTVWCSSLDLLHAPVSFCEEHRTESESWHTGIEEC